MAYAASGDESRPEFRSRENPRSMRSSEVTTMLPGRSCTETDARRSIAPPRAIAPETTACSPNRMILPGADAVVNGWPPSGEDNRPVPDYLMVVAAHIAAGGIGQKPAGFGSQSGGGSDGSSYRSIAAGCSIVAAYSAV